MAVGSELLRTVAGDTSALMAEIAAEQAKNLTPTDLGLFLNLFSDAPLNYVVDEALLDGLRRIKQRGLVDILEDRLEMGATVTVREIAGLTEIGSRAAEGLLSLLPVPDPETLGEDVRILIDLASSTRVKVKKTRRALRAIENLVRSGHIKTIASSENPLAELHENFNLDDVVELTRLGRRVLGIEKTTESTPETPGFSRKARH